MSSITQCILLGLLATTLSNLGMGVQKAGSDWMDGGLKGLKQRSNLWLFLVWVGGIVMCAVAPISLGLALVRGPASLVSALGAFGLVPLYLFAGFVLKETINRWHYLALALILAGVAWVAYRGTALTEEVDVLHTQALLLASLAAIVLPGLFAAVALRARWKLVGLPLGALSGVFGGLALLVLEVGDKLNAWWASGGAWIAVSAMAFLVQQVAYRRSTAVQIIPTSSALAVLTPVLIAPVAFDESVHLWLVGGIVVIFLGLACIGQGEREGAAQQDSEA